MTQHPISRFPAILLGGPPHAGKSVLAYCLKEELRKAGVQCYLLRAAPDGEGDWSQGAQPEVVGALRRKGNFTADWIDQICLDIEQRPLPFLVDAGGDPRPWDEAIFDRCTHAILLTKDADTQLYWQAIAAKYNLIIIADLTSTLGGEAGLETEQPILKGIITSLERGRSAEGVVFEALLARVKALFGYSYDELFNIHQAQAATDLVIDLPQLCRQLYPERLSLRWQPQDLPDALHYLPQDSPLALYGIGPAWLYAAVANSIYPNPFYQFDARRGWVKPVSLLIDSGAESPLRITVEEAEAYLQLTFDILDDYLEYEPEFGLPLPPVPEGRGVILSGKLPLWLYTGLVLFYRQAAWVGVYYPYLDKAIVVGRCDTVGIPEIGALVSPNLTGS